MQMKLFLILSNVQDLVEKITKGENRESLHSSKAKQIYLQFDDFFAKKFKIQKRNRESLYTF